MAQLSLGMQVVKLSNTVQTLPRQVTSNVHGVAQCFLDVGRASAATPASECIPFRHVVSHRTNLCPMYRALAL